MNKVVLSISHTNYMTRSAGTEKCLRNLSRIMLTKGYNHLNIFAFYSPKRYGLIGINYNDKFLGIFDIDDIEDVVNDILRKRNAMIETVHIQHLWHFDIKKISNFLLKIDAPIVLFIHDYYMICSNFNLIKKENIDECGEFCGIEKKYNLNCNSCIFLENSKVNRKNIDDLIDKNYMNIKSVICPSNYVVSAVKNNFPLLDKKIVLRPHLLTYGEKKYNKCQGKIKIAYLGSQNHLKGYDDWKRFVDFVNENCLNKYELYYLGKGKEKLINVTNIYVSAVEQNNDAMVDAIKNNEINCVFLWSVCGETYSYTYYEACECGAFVLTNDVSGNICDSVKLNKNGRVFKTLIELFDFVRTDGMLENSINDYLLDGKYHPKNFVSNSDISTIVFENKNRKELKNYVKYSYRRHFLLSLMYIVKFFKFKCFRESFIRK